MSEFTNLRVDVVNGYYNDFGNEQENFNNSARSFFNSSYFYFNNDDIVVKMRRNLESKYNRINTGYSKIRDWWGRYLRDARAVESVLSHDGGYINSMLVDNKVKMLRELLSEYDENNNRFVYFNLSRKTSSISGGISDTDGIDGVYQLLCGGLTMTDIDRLRRGDITIEELMIEIESDSNNSRRKRLETAAMLACIRENGIDCGNSLEDFEQIINVNLKQMSSLRDEFSNYAYEKMKLDAEIFVITKMREGCTLEQALSWGMDANFGYTYYDELGNKQYGAWKMNSVLFAEEAIPNENMVYIADFKNADFVEEIRKIVGDKKGNSDPTIDGTLWHMCDMAVQRRDELNNQLSNSGLHDKMVKQNALLMNQQALYADVKGQIDYEFTYIDPYTSRKNYLSNCGSNTVNFDKERLYSFSDDYHQNISFNLVLDEKSQVEFISAMLNGEVSVENTNAFLQTSTTYINGMLMSETDDSIVAHYAKWKMVITEKEIGCFNYIYKTQGESAAYNYLNSISKSLDKRYVIEKAKRDSEYATESGLNMAIASVESVVLTPIEGMHAFFQTLDSLFSGDDILSTDVYSKGNVERSAVSNWISDKDAAIGFLYDTIMSMTDSSLLVLSNVLVPGSGCVVSPALMGSRVYVSTLNDALDRGLSDKQAYALAFVAAITESACENYSTGHLLNLEGESTKVLAGALDKVANCGMSDLEKEIVTKTLYIFGSAAIQGVCEGEEELCTEICNYLADELISGELSNSTLEYNNYLMNGYSAEEASDMVGKNMIKQFEMSFLGGLVSGVGFGGFSGTKTAHRVYNNLAKTTINQYENGNPGVFADSVLSAKEVKNKIGKENYQNLGSQISSLIADNCNDVGLDIRISNLGVNNNVSLEQSYNAISDVLKIADNAAATDSFLGIHRAGAMVGNEAQFFERGIIISGHTGNAGIELTKQSDVKTQSDLVDVLGTNISFENLELNGVDSNGNVALDNNRKGQMLADIALGGSYKNYLDDGTIMIVSIPKTATDAYIQDQKGTYVLNTKYIVGYVTTNNANNSIDNFTMNPNFYNQSILGESTTVEHGTEVKNNVGDIATQSENAEKYSVVEPFCKMIKLYGIDVAYDMIMNDNYSAIVNEQLRESISSISGDALTDFIVDMRNLDFVKSSMYNKYGEAGFENFKSYLEDGDVKGITRDNSARIIAENISEQSRQAYKDILQSLQIKLGSANSQNLSLGTSSDAIQGRDEVSKFFISAGDFNESTYGIDQSCIEKMCTYELDGEVYNYQQAKNIVNQAKEQNSLIPRFRKIATSERYFELKDKLVGKGFSDDEASVILSSIDDLGACSYAAAVNMMLYKFRNDQALFEKTFGYSMYRYENGTMVFNEELLLDLYIFANDTANGGSFITDNHLNQEMLSDTIDVFGRNILNSEEQVFISSSAGVDAKLLTDFLSSKYSGLYVTSEFIINNSDAEVLSDDQITDMVNRVDEQLNKNKIVQLGIYSNAKEIRLQAPTNANYESVSTETWDEGDGHAVTITGITDNAFLVTSWGNAYFIPFEDLSGGPFVLNSLDIYNLAGNKVVNDTINTMNRQIAAGINPAYYIENINNINLDYLLEIINGVSDNSKIEFEVGGKYYNVDQLIEMINGVRNAYYITDWNQEVDNYNKLSQQQDKVVYNFSSLDDIPKDFINSVNDPTKLIFRVNDVEYTIDDLKRVPDSNKQTDNIRHTAELNNTVDEVLDLDNTIDEVIDLDHTAKLDNTIDEVLDLDEANKNTHDEDYWNSQIAFCNVLAKNGQVAVYELSSFDEIPVDFINKLDDPTVLRFVIDGKTYNIDDLKGIKTTNNQQSDNMRHTAKLSDTVKLGDTLELDQTEDLSEDLNSDPIDYSNKVAEIKNYLENKIQETSNRNISNLKEQLMSSVVNIDDPIARARKLYLELNKNLSYNETYSALTYINNRELLDEIIDNANNETLNLDKLVDDKVICIEWAQLYYDTLISAGFSPDDVMIKGGTGHQWVTLKLPNGKVLIADATDVMNGSNDLTNCRLGDETNGFVVTGMENANLRLTDNTELTLSQYSELMRLDKSIEYINANGYFSEQVSEYARLSGLMDANYDSTEILVECLEAEIPPTYTGQEAFIYFRKVAKNIHNYGIIKEHMNNTIYPVLVNGNLEILNEVSFEYNGKTLYRFYSENTGNHIFDNIADRDAYKATLETFERGDIQINEN